MGFQIASFAMEAALACEKIWFEKNKYDEAEKIYYEHLAKVCFIKEEHFKKLNS